MKETWVPSLGREDPLEKEIATHSSILSWKIPWTEEASGLQSMWVINTVLHSHSPDMGGLLVPSWAPEVAGEWP